MAHLIQLKTQIRSIKTTKKITQAMRLIAMSLYSRLNKRQAALQNYKNSVKQLFAEIAQQCPEWTNATFFPTDILDTNPLFIVISSTKGFCGGLNNNLFRYIEQKMFVEEHQSPNFITIGKKATNFIKENRFGAIVKEFHDLNSNNFSDISRLVANIIIDQPQPYSSVTICSNFFKNFFIQRPTYTKIIPLTEEPPLEVPLEITPQEMTPLWEQDPEEILHFMAKHYLNTCLTDLIFQALISEYAARFVAMDNATTNAENFLGALTLQFNKTRQSLITREVSELSASL